MNGLDSGKKTSYHFCRMEFAGLIKHESERLSTFRSAIAATIRFSWAKLGHFQVFFTSGLSDNVLFRW